MDLTPYIPYVLGALVLVLLYAKDRETFQKIATAAFLAVEKELGTAEGQDKMAAAVLKIIDTLPARIKTALNGLAALRKTDLNGLVHELAQATYDLILKPTSG